MTTFYRPNPKQREGQTLVEVTLAVGIFGTAVVGVLGLLSMAINFHNTSQERTMATFLAQKVFADLELPMQDVDDTDVFRFLNYQNPVVNFYGDTLNTTEDVIPDSSSPPLTWVFDTSLENIPYASSTSQFENESSQVYRNGSDEPEAAFLVGVRLANQVEFFRGNDSTDWVDLELDEGMTSPIRVALVTVETPAQAPETERRKYDFMRVIIARF